MVRNIFEIYSSFWQPEIWCDFFNFQWYLSKN